MLVSLLFLGLASAASIVQRSNVALQTILNVDDDWKNVEEGKLYNVRLDKRARTGVVPIAVEEGIIQTVGYRFANEFYANMSEDSGAHTTDIGFCFSQCGSTVIKEVPCVWKAVKEKDPSALLKCGVSKDDLCKCTPCLPKQVREFVDQFCKSSDENAKVEDVVPYSDFYNLGSDALAVQAFLGNAYNYRLTQASAQVQGSSSKSKYNFVTGISCPWDPCGGCCCIGACILGKCVGGCI